MKESEGRGVTRRVVLTGAKLTLGAAMAAQAASCALVQVSKAEAKYQDMPHGDERCAGCVHFQAPNGCSVVQGPISPNGWCTRYSAKR